MNTVRHQAVEAADETVRAAELRDRLVDELVAEGRIRTPAVKAAFRAVPRHVFAPGEPLEKAYAAHDVVAAKRDESGATVSTISAPWLQALMLEQAGVGPGMRVLEVGLGGYNAALLAEVVGPEGEVTTVDIDPEVVDRARACLLQAGYPDVRVVLADAESGVADRAPYDLIMVTAEAWDIPWSWVDQLTGGGTLIVPLRLRSLVRAVTFVEDRGRLVSRSAEVCGFVPMRGAGAHAERQIRLRDGDVVLCCDDGWPVDADSLDAALGTPRIEAWSGVTIALRTPFDTLQMWLATAFDGYARIALRAGAQAGPLSLINRSANDAVVADGSLAYLAARRSGDGVAEFGAHGFGPDAQPLVNALVHQVRVWDREHREGPGPTITIVPAGTADDGLPVGRVIDKPHTRTTITWPATSAAPGGPTTNP